MEPVGVGVIGCGNISSVYLRNLGQFSMVRLVGCADALPERARERAEEFGIRAYPTVDALLSDPDIELVVNLTVPRAHAEITLRSIEAGKSVYSEKPLAITREDGRRIVTQAQARGVRVGCAPDTFFGGGLQTVRKLIDDGWIGQPVAATAFMLSHGPEGWHPEPDFFYQPGGGPLFDMGPYYLTALVHLLGPVRQVTAMARISFPERTIRSRPRYGERIPVQVPTHVAGVLEFSQGAVCSLVMSFDSWGTSLPNIEIYGSEGTLWVPDPNTFGGPVRLRRAGSKEWSEVPLLFGRVSNMRGLGVLDMAYALRHARPHRASDRMAYHVLDVMETLYEASRAERFLPVQSEAQRPAPLPTGLPDDELDG